MKKIFTSTVALQNYIESACSKAVENTVIKIKDKLRDFIDEQYYNDPEFYPNWYQRTEEFLNSCAYEMLSPTKAQIGIDTDNMHYSNNFSGEQVAIWASKSMHGATYYQTNTQSYWDAFLEWADKNVVLILKDELMKQGIKTI